MTYNDLAHLFPYMVSGTKIEVAQMVRALVDPKRTDVQWGSSFAMVSGVMTPGRIPLYLSEVSYNYLCARGFITHSISHLVSPGASGRVRVVENNDATRDQ